MNKLLDKLILDINYEFTNIDLLKTALTHSSYRNENKKSVKKNNERLEFLGDSVLNLVIAEYLFYNCKDLREGSLSKMRSQIVNEQSLYEIARKISLEDYILLGKGELKNNGNFRASILADCLEAIIGSIFIDGGIDCAKDSIIYIFEDKLKEVIFEKKLYDYKSVLQEYVQKNKLGVLSYNLLDEEGPDNNKKFYYTVLIDNKVIASGVGISKKKSQQCAAKNALEKFGELNVEN